MVRRVFFTLAVLACFSVVPHAWANTTLVPNDTYYNSYEWYAPLMNMPQAWGISQGSSNVTIAILDTGVRADTPDLAGRVLPALKTNNYNDPFDGKGGGLMAHGTWVASVAAAQINNAKGLAGVGDFSILPISVTTSSTTSPTNSSQWIADGIRLAADSGAKVINISQATLDYGQLDAAAAYAKTKGALTFIAAGNSGTRNSMTGFDNLLFVSGTDHDAQGHDIAWSGSTYGPYVDISAPANNILVALNNGLNYSTGGDYGLGAGTSFACPLVAGAAALAWSINPNLSPDAVWNMIKSTAVDLGTPGWDEQFGWGRLNVGGVASAALASVPEPATLALVVPAGAMLLLRRRRS